MTLSYVIRLREDALADGRFVGEIEDVSNAKRRAVTTVEQIAAFVFETARTEPTDSEDVRRTYDE